MERRAFIAGALGFLAMPLTAQAQLAGKVARIGFLRAASPQPADLEAFRQGLRDLGHIEGQQVMIEPRYAAGVVARLPDLAAELVRLQPDVIVVDGTLAAKAAGAATSTIPIVFTLVSDPVASGSLRASRGRAGTSRGCPTSAATSRLSGSSFSRRHWPGPPVSPSCRTPST